MASKECNQNLQQAIERLLVKKTMVEVRLHNILKAIDDDKKCIKEYLENPEVDDFEKNALKLLYQREQHAAATLENGYRQTMVTYQSEIDRLRNTA